MSASRHQETARARAESSAGYPGFRQVPDDGLPYSEDPSGSSAEDYKLVFLTDRTQFDEQLTATFRRAQGESVLNAKSVGHLKELLKDASDLVTATIQKLQEDEDFGFACLNDSDRIIVLADEAHRTQYGTLGAAINTALPNAPKIAFTGTP